MSSRYSTVACARCPEIYREKGKKSQGRHSSTKRWERVADGYQILFPLEVHVFNSGGRSLRAEEDPA